MSRISSVCGSRTASVVSAMSLPNCWKGRNFLLDSVRTPVPVKPLKLKLTHLFLTKLVDFLGPQTVAGACRSSKESTTTLYGW